MRSQSRQVLAVRRIVDETTKVHAVRARKVTEDVPGADLVALVGWIGNAMRKEQQVPHVVQPRPRMIDGPIRLAIGSGRSFRAAMNRRYWGLSGLWSAMVAPLVRR